MCGRVDETVNHVLSECSKMAQTEYKRQHDWVVVTFVENMVLRWRKTGMNISQNQLWKMRIVKFCGTLTSKQTMWSKPDVLTWIVIDKVKKICTIIDFAIHYDSRVNNKEIEKIEKYQDLARELRTNLTKAS